MMLKIFLSVIYQVKKFLEDASRDAETLEKQKCLRPSSVPIKACIFEALGGPPAKSSKYRFTFYLKAIGN